MFAFVGVSLTNAGNRLIMAYQAGYVGQPLRRSRSDWTAAGEQPIGRLHAELTTREVHAALTNALERIVIIERERDEPGEIFKAFNEMVDASRVHDPGVLDKQ